MATFSNDLAELIKIYWEKRGKQWESNTKEMFYQKIRELR